MRGTSYDHGEIYFKITNDGLFFFPRLNPDVSIESYDRNFTQKLSTGIKSLDEMFDGGIPESTVTLVSGGAGTGKTLMAAHFAFQGLENGESVLFSTFEENPKQFIDSTLSIGLDFRPYLETEQFMLIHASPVEIDTDEHIFRIQDCVRKQKINRLILDSISSFEIGILDKIKYTDYIWTLTNFLKAQGVTTLMTHEIQHSMQITELTKHGISYVADNLILLENKECDLDMKSYIRIVKCRSSSHEKNLREYHITGDGISISAAKTIK